MSWARQVVHVARKDIRFACWPIVAHVAITGFATATSVLMRDIGLGPFGWSVLLVLSGMIVIAMLVQADSPSRSDAFWVTHPLRPSAVFAAKVLTAAFVLCGPALVGQALALRALAVPAGDYPALLATSAVSYGLWLAVIAVLASLTSSFRSLFVTVVALLIALQLAGSLLIQEQFDGGGVALDVAPPLFVWPSLGVLMLLLLAHQYHTRSVRRGVVLVGVLYAVMWTVQTATSRPALPDSSASHNLSAEPRPVLSARLDSASLAPDRPVLLVVLLRDPPAGSRYRLLQPTVVLITGAGREHVLEVTGVNDPFGATNWRGGSAEPPQGMRWIGDVPESDSLLVSVRRTPVQAALLRAGAARLVVRGLVEVQQRKQPVVVPLQTGRTTVAHGTRVRLLHAQQDAGDLDIRLGLTLVMPAGSRRIRIRGRPGAGDREGMFTLVHTARGEAFPLTERGSHSNPLGLVLPGPAAWNGGLQLAQRWHHASASAIPDAEWLDGAHVHVSHWYFSALHPIEVEVR